MSTSVTLKAEERERFGTGGAREIRRNHNIPAIIYGGGKKEIMVTLNSKELEREFHKAGFMSRLLDIELGKQKHKVIPKDMQLHPVTDLVLHADFIFVNEKDTIKVMVDIHFKNKETCIGLKHGGVLNVVMHQIELHCPALNIPELVEVDLESLDIGHSLHVKDIKLPEGATFTHDEELTIAGIVGRKAEEEERPAGEGEEGAEAEGEGDEAKAEGSSEESKKED